MPLSARELALSPGSSAPGHGGQDLEPTGARLDLFYGARKCTEYDYDYPSSQAAWVDCRGQNLFGFQQQTLKDRPSDSAEQGLMRNFSSSKACWMTRLIVCRQSKQSTREQLLRRAEGNIDAPQYITPYSQRHLLSLNSEGFSKFWSNQEAPCCEQDDCPQGQW